MDKLINFKLNNLSQLSFTKLLSITRSLCSKLIILFNVWVKSINYIGRSGEASSKMWATGQSDGDHRQNARAQYGMQTSAFYTYNIIYLIGVCLIIIIINN
jgi:hypothetical protein